MINYCKKCGSCCQAIWLRYSIKDIREILKKYPSNLDAIFILKNWERISYKDALKINSRIKIFKKNYKKSYFYICNKYDKINKKCTIHDNKPRICKDYPFYGKNKIPLGLVFYNDKCGFNNNKLIELQK
jgi:Fe-S-cluster containining protein